MSENVINYPFLTIGVIGSFLVVNLVVGWFSGKNVRTLNDYALANKSLGTGPLVITLIATIIGAKYMTSKISDAWEYGIIITVVQSGGYVMTALVLSWFVFPKLVHFKGCYTLGDIMGRIYGPHVRLFTGLLTSLFSILAITGQLVAIGGLSHQLGIGKSQLIIGVGIAITCYTWFGGIRSVTATDIFQFVFIVTGLVFITNLVIQKATVDSAGGFWSIFSNVRKVVMQSQHTSSAMLDKFLIWEYPELGFILASTFFLTIYPTVFMTPPVIQRILMTQTTSQLKSIFAGFSIFYPLFRFLIFVLGLGIFLITKDDTIKEVDILDRLMSVDIFGESLLVYFLLILIFIGITMSTADSFLNALAILFVRDIVQPMRGGKHRSINEVRWIRYSTLLAGSLCTLLALIVQESLPTSLLVFASISLSSICVPFLAGVLGLKGDYKSFFWGTFVFIFISVALLFLANDNFFGLGKNVYLRRKYYYLFPVPVLMSSGVFFLMHYIRYGEFRMENRKETAKLSWLDKVGSWYKKWLNPVVWINTSLYRYRNQSTLFGLFFCAIYLVPNLSIDNSRIEYVYFLFGLSTIGVVLCVGLLLHGFWHKRLTKYYSLYWLVVVLYCIPFTHTLLFLCRPSEPFVLVQCIITSLLLVILVEWDIFICLTVLGGLLGMLVYMLMPDSIVYPTSLSVFDGFIHFCLILFLLGIAVGGMLVFNYQKNRAMYEKLKQNKLLSAAFAHELKNILHGIPDLSLNNLINKHIGQQPIVKEGKLFINLKDYKELIIFGASIERELTHAQEVIGVFKHLVQTSLTTSQNMVVRDIRNIINACWQKLTIEKRDRVLLPAESDDFDIKLYSPLFFHVIYNLVNNAFEHGKATEVSIYWEKPTRRLYLKDNGKGIAKKVLPDLFPSSYIDNNARGVGLPFVKMILEDIGATIELVSTGTKGTLFAINFPIVKAGEKSFV